uniref:Uncharacterized protein n=1 Tax=Physcomitrium patens TaxID=3218 RepID=A0A2K1KAF9_PHYPA|nr:hypothetical protein PHYPA_009950 [Physcomitrium patens]
MRNQSPPPTQFPPPLSTHPATTTTPAKSPRRVHSVCSVVKETVQLSIMPCRFAHDDWNDEVVIVVVAAIQKSKVHK